LDEVMSLETVDSTIDDFARRPTSSPEHELREAAVRVLEELGREFAKVLDKANEFGNFLIDVNVMMTGATLGSMAERYAGLLNQRGFHDLEEQAQRLRCQVVLTVQGHYRHIVGPAMIACAECNERLGNALVAAEMYQAVIADFSWLVDVWARTDEAPGDEDRCSLHCLAQAIKGVLKFRPDGTDVQAMESLHQQCEEILARSGQDEP
jgi:hypothetical protein